MATKKTAVKAAPTEPAAPAAVPTPHEALAMFADRPDLAEVETTDGLLRRDGTLI